jgi:toxin YoeB
MARVRWLLVVEPQFIEDLTQHVASNPRLGERVLLVVQHISRDPFRGIGKPEQLRHGLAGYWSRRVNDEHRLVYRVEGDTIYFVQCRFHYDR